MSSFLIIPTIADVFSITSLCILKIDNIKVYSKQYTWDNVNQQLVHSLESDNGNVFKAQDTGMIATVLLKLSLSHATHLNKGILS